MKYTTTTSTTSMVVSYLAACADAWYKKDSAVDEASWTPARETRYTPVAGFVLRPTPTWRVPRRVGLRVAAKREKDDDDDDDDEDKSIGKLTRGTATSSTATSGTVPGSVVTSMPANPSNTCGWDKNGGGFFACSDAKASCIYTAGVASCCPTSGRCGTLPQKCVEKKCDSDSDGNTLCCHATSAPHCYTWLMPTSASGKQETYSLLGCTDKAGVGTLLPTDPASSNSSSSGNASGRGGGHGVNGGTIAGAVIGGLAALGLLALLLLYIRRQRKRGTEESRRAQEEQKKKDDEDEEFRRDFLAAHKKGYDVDRGLGMTQDTTINATSAATVRDRNSSNMHSPETDRSVAILSPNGHLSHSVSGVSRTTRSSPVPSPSPLAGVAEAPDTAVEESASPVEVAGTKITRESMQTRYELA